MIIEPAFTESPARRLAIDSIVLQNFKSYAGKVQIGPFHSNFSSVVGPNGSGKSNLIESLLFVFGFKASWMRLSKLNQLIHNSYKNPDNYRAFVEVNFVFMDQFNAKHPGFTLRRQVNKNSVSLYSINGVEHTAHRVKQILSGYGIDLSNNRFLILQGEVQLISQMKPKSGDVDNPGLLEYLQTIIGSIEFKFRIQQLSEELLVMEQSRHEIGQRMKIQENEAVKLQCQKEKAIEIVKKEKTLFQIKNILGQLSVKVQTENEEKALLKLKEAETRKEEVKKAERAKIATHNNITQKLTRLRKIKTEIEREMTGHQQRVNCLKLKDQQLIKQLQFTASDLLKAEQGIQQAKQSLMKIKKSAQQIKERKPKIEQENSQNKQILLKLQNQLTRIGYSESAQVSPQLEDTLEDYAAHRRTVESKVNALKEHPALAERKDNKEAGQLQSRLLRQNENLQKLQSKIQNFRKVMQKIKPALADNQAQINTLKNLELQHLHEIEKRNFTISQKDQLSSGIHSRLLKAQQDGKLSGLIGRLGDLGSIQEKFDVSVSNSTPGLDNMLVRTEQQGSKVLRYLKENKIGVITLICLDKIKQFQQRANRPFTAPAEAKRLFDLVTCADSDARTAFYFLLQNTLVCQDMKIANQIAYGHRDGKRYRVVTLSGNVINLDGSQFGGGNPRRGLMGKGKKAVSKEEIEKAQREVRGLIADLEEVKKQSSKLQQKQYELSNDQRQCNIQIQALQKKRYQQKAQVEEVKKTLSLVSKGDGLSRTDEKQLRTQLQKLELQLKSAIEKEELCRREVQQRQAKERKKLTPEVQDKLLKLQKYKELYKKSQNEYLKLKADIQSISKRQLSAQNDLVQWTGKSQQLKRISQALKASQQELENEAMERVMALNQSKEKKSKLDQQQKEVKSENQAFDKQLKLLKEKLDQFKEQFDRLRAEISRAHQATLKARDLLLHNRAKFQDIIHNYPFLLELDLIEAMTFNSKTVPNQMFEVSFLNVTMVEEKTGRRRSSLNSPLLERLLKGNPLEDLDQKEMQVSLDHMRGLQVSEPVEQQKLKHLQSQGTNINVILEFKIKYESFKKIQEEYNQIKARYDLAKSEIIKLKDARLKAFLNGFTTISAKVKEVYQLLTTGGDAELQLVDSLDPFSDGISFSVRPPKKSWKQISKLSGGEKTLSSLSLVFALHYYKPTPLYFMDEIDAALDYKNVAVVANYIKQRTKDAQFIIISLRNNMFELADKLVGVYKVQDMTRVVCLVPQAIINKQNKDPNYRP